MTTKDRIFKNTATSVIGIAIMLLAVYFVFINIKSLDMTKIFLAAALGVLGYVFLVAKNSLLEGLFLGFFKVGKKESEPK